MFKRRGHTADEKLSYIFQATGLDSNYSNGGSTEPNQFSDFPCTLMEAGCSQYPGHK